MANSYSIGRLFGIPIRVHVTLLIFLPLFAFSFMPVDGPQGLFYGALGAVGLFASVALHEIGHSLVARAKGSRILEILLLPIGGMARLTSCPSGPPMKSKPPSPAPPSASRSGSPASSGRRTCFPSIRSWPSWC